MSRSEKKAFRLLQVETLLLAHPEGLTQAEIARRLNVNRSTIGRYKPDLPKHIYIDDLDGEKWKVAREAYLINVRFNLHEALSVHLAARLLATRMDRQNPHAAAALRKLGLSLERLAPRISIHLLQSADVSCPHTRGGESSMSSAVISRMTVVLTPVGVNRTPWQIPSLKQAATRLITGHTCRPKKQKGTVGRNTHKRTEFNSTIRSGPITYWRRINRPAVCIVTVTVVLYGEYERISTRRTSRENSGIFTKLERT